MVSLHEAFQRADDSGDGQLEWEEIRVLLIEYDLLPHRKGMLDQVIKMYHGHDSDQDGKITFREYLRFVEALRMDRVGRGEFAFREMFASVDKNHNASLDIAEVSLLLVELGVQPYSRDDQLEIRNLIDEVDTDGTGDLCYEEFVAFVKRVRERLAVAARRRRRLVAAKLGFGERYLAELRELFWTLDVEDSGSLTLEQLRRALEMLRVSIDPAELHAAVAKSCQRPQCSGKSCQVSLDFDMFLYFVHAVAPAEMPSRVSGAVASWRVRPGSPWQYV